MALPRLAKWVLGLGGASASLWAASTYQESARTGEDRVISREEVARHRTLEQGVWVTYQGNVYDVTKYVRMHPGGRDKIMQAAGGDLEPFWRVYRQHQRPYVRRTLEAFRIGRLPESEMSAATSTTATTAAVADPYSNDPVRSPLLRVVSERPFNAETPLPLLVQSYLTPNELFFVRNHLPVPQVDPTTFRLRIEGVGMTPRDFSLDELRARFPVHEVTATLQCSGNRRHEMGEVRPVQGLDWGAGAISTARWRGVRLADVLRAAGVVGDTERPAADGANAATEPPTLHVHLEGLDNDGRGTHYAVSVPLWRVLRPDSDVLLAMEMNGAPLPRDHGFPLRVVVPGVTGARSVKWLHRVQVRPDESQSTWQQRDYKLLPPTARWDAVDWSAAPAMMDTAVQSAICVPVAGDTLTVDARDPHVLVHGYAYSGGGRGIMRVTVSADGGQSWVTADLQRDRAQVDPRAWAWTLWSARVPVPADATEVTLAVCAMDTACNSQPEHALQRWNFRGLMHNAWHRVPVQLRAERPAA